MFQNSQPDSLLQAPVPAQVDDGATVVSTFSERLEHSFALLGEFVPALAGALAILFAGYLIAKVVEKGTQRLLRRLHFNQLLERGGVMQAVERSGSHLNPAKVIANLLFWFIMFAVLLVAANAIGMESLANVFSELVSYIPSVIAAIVIIILGIVLGGFVGGLIMASAGGLHGGPWLARIGRGGVIVLAIFMALQELGIATDIVTTAFAILFGAVALALALSFGLGNRDLAAEVTREWYQRYRAEREAIEAEAAAEEAEELAEEASEAEEEAKEREKTTVSASRVASVLLLALILPAGSIVAQATRPATTKPAAKAPAKTPAELAIERAERAALAEEERFFERHLMQERARYLEKASWAALGDRCNPGDLRVFPADTSFQQREATQRIIDGMERTVIARGVGGSLATPEARQLLHTIVGWEAAWNRPRWDSDETAPRQAVAAGLTGEVPDPNGPGCLNAPGASDTVNVVVPGFTAAPFPAGQKPVVRGYFGPRGQGQARDAFYAAKGRVDPSAELKYILVAPVVVWRDWAVVTVNRPRERGGVEIGRASDGGATYLMRRVVGEWRLTSIVRTWGS